MNEKELKKEMKKAKEKAKKIIENNDKFIVFAEDDALGCSTLPEMCMILVLGLRNIKRDIMGDKLMQEVCNLIMCEDMDKYLNTNGKKIIEELEKNK